MIVVTGAYGFIGSCLVQFLNEKGFDNIVAVDDFSKTIKEPNLAGKKIAERVARDNFFDWLETNGADVDFIFHLGARTDTTEFDYSIHQRLNVDFSVKTFEYCTNHSIPIIYASSAATYGAGELGYDDSTPSVSEALEPLNPYGVSKNEFDKWVLKQQKTPPFWAGMKFFNVYGPNENHKGRMASTIWHFFNQIEAEGSVRLFKSHRPDFGDGEQMRDFVYVKDVLNVLFFLFEKWENTPSGIYNLGTGTARSFNDLVKSVFENVGKPLIINYIDTPFDIRDKYQYFTEAKMEKLLEVGYDDPFSSLEEGIADYVQHYLKAGKYY